MLFFIRILVQVAIWKVFTVVIGYRSIPRVSFCIDSHDQSTGIPRIHISQNEPESPGCHWPDPIAAREKKEKEQTGIAGSLARSDRKSEKIDRTLTHAGMEIVCPGAIRSRAPGRISRAPGDFSLAGQPTCTGAGTHAHAWETSPELLHHGGCPPSGAPGDRYQPAIIVTCVLLRFVHLERWGF
jgi:hypothetical protein